MGNYEADAQTPSGCEQPNRGPDSQRLPSPEQRAREAAENMVPAFLIKPIEGEAEARRVVEGITKLTAAEILKVIRGAEANALQRAAERYVPRLMFSADDGGTLSLHWRFESGGVLVVFSGDEMAHISIKASPAEQYSMNGEDALIDGALHDKIVSAIRSLLPKEEGQAPDAPR